MLKYRLIEVLYLMDELIKNILKELDIDDCFIQNQRAYRVLKFYYRTKLTDIYKYYVLVNKKEKVQCSSKEISEKIFKENFNWNTMRDFISADDVEMMKFLNSKKQNEEQWNKIIEQLKSNNPILSVDLDVVIKNQQLNITYLRDNKKEKTYMFYDNSTDCVDILSVQEDTRQEKTKKIRKKENIDMDFSEYEKIRLNIPSEKSKIKSRDKKKEVSQVEKNSAVVEGISDSLELDEFNAEKENKSEKNKSNKSYYILYEKVERSGTIIRIDAKEYDGDFDVNKINKTVNKLETKYNKDILGQLTETIVNRASTIKEGFRKSGKNDAGKEKDER